MADLNSGKNDSQSDRTVNPEIDREWVTVVYRVYERMIHASEVSFFLSTPQLVSTLGFLIGACSPEVFEKAKSLISGYEDGKKEKTGGVEVDYMISDTIDFVHTWSLEFRGLFGPNQYRQGRRVYACPNFMRPHQESSFQMFRKFRVEEKVFEGPKEIREWMQKVLRVQFPADQKCLAMWDLPEDQPPDQKKKPKKPKRSLLERIGSKLTFGAIGSKNKKSEYSSWHNSIKNPTEQEKKPPILVWISHAIVEMPKTFFDSQNIFCGKDGRQFLRIHESKETKIHCVKGEHHWKSVFLPTLKPKLTLIIFYDFVDELCPLPDLVRYIATHRPLAPCVVRPDVDKPGQKRTVFIPYWHTKDFCPSRIAQHLVAANVCVDGLFVSGGFGDLAGPDAVPSASGDVKKVSHVQNFGIMTFKDRPKHFVLQETKPARKNRPAQKELVPAPRYRIEDPTDPLVELVQYPICVVLWDGQRELPAYMGKITGNQPDYQLDSEQSGEKKKKKKKKRKKKKRNSKK